MITRRAFLLGSATAAGGIFVYSGSASAVTPGELAVQAARAQIGVPYVRVGQSPDVGFDCSGLVAWAWRAAGFKILPQTVALAVTLREVPLSEMMIGDLVLPEPLGHVVIVSGNDRCIQAQRPGTKVFEGPMIRNGALCLRPTLPVIRKVPSAPAAGYEIVSAQSGDTVRTLSNGDEKMLKFARLNGLSPSSPLVVGDRLARLPVTPPLAPKPTPTSAPAAGPRGTTPTASAPKTTPLVLAPVPAPPIVPKSSASVYAVRPGDTLAVIAGRQGTTVDRLVQLNGIANPDRIYVGQILQLSKP